jgi:hypothetical protein
MSEKHWLGKDFYAVLGVGIDATQSDIQSEYRWLAKKFHPDVNPGDTRSAKRFQEINEAYEVLSNPGRRSEYDSSRSHSFGVSRKPPYPTRATKRRRPEASPSTAPPRPKGTGHPPPEAEPAAGTEEASSRVGPIVGTVILCLFLLVPLAVAVGGAAGSGSSSTSSTVSSNQTVPESADLQTCEQFWSYVYPTNWWTSVEGPRAAAARINNMARAGNSSSVSGALSSLVRALGIHADTLELQVSVGGTASQGNEFSSAPVVSADEYFETVCRTVFSQNGSTAK